MRQQTAALQSSGNIQYLQKLGDEIVLKAALPRRSAVTGMGVAVTRLWLWMYRGRTVHL